MIREFGSDLYLFVAKSKYCRYEFAYHTRAVAITNDYFCWGYAFHILDRFGDVQTAARFTNEWEAVNQQMDMIEVHHIHAFQLLQAAQLQRAFEVVDIRWHDVKAKIEEMPDYK